MILGIIALIVVGPKELPGLLRTIGRYSGMLRKQAAEFRGHFDQAMREAELDQLQKDVTAIKDDITGAVRDTTKAFTDEIDSAKRQLEFPELDDPDAHDADGIPIHKPRPRTVEEAAAAVAAEEKARLASAEATSERMAENSAATETRESSEAAPEAPSAAVDVHPVTKGIAPQRETADAGAAKNGAAT